MPKITPCLWFDTQAEEAARFYVKIFRNSRIGKITHYGPNMPMPEGTVLSVSFKLNGQEFLAFNGKPAPKFTEAISFMVNCDTQREIDRMWKQLTAGGSDVQCGWLKDKFGVSWQVVPKMLTRMLDAKQPARANRVLQAILGMKKLDIAKLKKAHAGK